MTLPAHDDDFADGELSIEELEAIAAGWPDWVHGAVHAVEHAASWLTSNPYAGWVAKEAVLVGVLVGGHLIFKSWPSP
jgi:hypothetical protein